MPSYFPSENFNAGKKPYDMAPLMPIARTIAQQAVSSMMQWIEASYSFQNIILVGGGAFLFKKAVKDAFPKHKIHEVKDPMVPMSKDSRSQA